MRELSAKLTEGEKIRSEKTGAFLCAGFFVIYQIFSHLPIFAFGEISAFSEY